MNAVVQSARSKNELRAIELLGSGLSPVPVSQALGVSESTVSQWMSDPEFAAEVTTLRFQSLQQHSKRDNHYDTIEDKLIKQLSDNLPLMQRPMEILKAIQIINGAKRRGQTAPEQLANQSTVVTLLMPVAITQKFTTNVNNQVIVANGQTLETLQSKTLLTATKQKAEGLHNERPEYQRIENVSGPGENKDQGDTGK